MLEAYFIPKSLYLLAAYPCIDFSSPPVSPLVIANLFSEALISISDKKEVKSLHQLANCLFFKASYFLPVLFGSVLE